MMRYSNNERLSNDLTRMAYQNTDDKALESLNRKKQTLESKHLLPQINSEPFNNTSRTINPFKDIFPNQKQYQRNVEKIDTDLAMQQKDTSDRKDKTIDSMNSEINKLKNSLQEVIIKDKEIQELKNKITLLNKDLQESSGNLQKIKDLEMENKFIKKKLDEEYLISSEVKSMKKEVETIKEENTALRKKMLELNQRTNLFKLKKIIHKHTDCELDELNKILKENDITEDSFILNNINEKLIKKVIGLMNKKES